MKTVDEFLIAERSYCDDESKLSVGLANIHAEVPDIEANKALFLEMVERVVGHDVAPSRCAPSRRAS